MKRIISIFLIFSFALSLIFISCTDASAKSKPTVLCISAPYCKACKEFEPTFEAMRKKYSKKFNFEKEYFDNSKRAKTLNVTETPSVFILEKNNSKKISWQCLSKPGCFEQKLKEY